jgi:RNA polymerase sigma-70 factor (ECF subfamily)
MADNLLDSRPWARENPTKSLSHLATEWCLSGQRKGRVKFTFKLSAGDDPVLKIAAFSQLVEETRPYLKAVVARVLKGRLADKMDESDVVQDALARAMGRLAQCQGESPEQCRAWLVTIVRNHALNLLRYWGQQERDVQREQAIACESPDGAVLAAGSSTPSERAMRREQAARLAAAVEQLPPDYREVIRLREFEGLSHAEAAQRMGRSQQVVRQLWVRALKRLRVRLGGDQ